MCNDVISRYRNTNSQIEGRKDISGIFFSRKHLAILIPKLTFIKKWEIMKNYKQLLKNEKKIDKTIV